MQLKKSHVFKDGSSIEWIDRETLWYAKDGFSVLIWVDFEPGFFKSGRILRSSSIKEWASKPSHAPGPIDDGQRNAIVHRVQQYYRDHGTKITVEN